MELSFRFVCAPPQAAAHLPALPAADHWLGREYRRVVWLGDAPALLRLKSRGLVERPELEWRLEPGAAGSDQAAERERAAALVRRIVAAEVDLSACARGFGSDAVLRELHQRFLGLKLMRAPSLYECLASAILEQQLNFSFANQVKRRLLETFGPRLEFDGRVYYGFPRPEELAAAPVARLRALQISSRKADYLIGIARAAMRGELSEPELAGLAPAAAAEHLMQFAGVGEWTAAYALLRGVGHTDALPAGDVGLQRAVGTLYGLRLPATPRAIERRWRAVSPWRGYATLYAWFTLW